MPITEATKPKNHVARRVVAFNADQNGVDAEGLPTRVELVKAGTWPEMSNKGMLFITTDDLLEMKANFDAGVGTPGNSGQIAIDFKHEDADMAGCWIHAMEVEGDTLYGTELEFTATGKAMILGGEFKFLSPSFYPACLGEWSDPEDWSIKARNVVVGAGFTNIPFFKRLTPVKASQNSQEGDDKNLLFVDASSERSNMPTLEDIRVKASVDVLSEDEKTLLTAHQSELTTEEKVKFGFETAPVVTASNTNNEGVQMTEEQKKDAQVLADIRDGKLKLVNASEHDSLVTSVTELKGKIQASEHAAVVEQVKAHVDRGAIKADRADAWVARVEADATVLDDLALMQADPVLASELGSDAGAGTAITASDEVREKANALVKAAKDDGKTLDIGAAYSKVLADDKDLSDRLDNEKKGVN